LIKISDLNRDLN